MTYSLAVLPDVGMISTHADKEEATPTTDRGDAGIAAEQPIASIAKSTIGTYSCSRVLVFRALGQPYQGGHCRILCILPRRAGPYVCCVDCISEECISDIVDKQKANIN